MASSPHASRNKPLPLFASSPLRLYASTPLRLYASTPLRLYASPQAALEAAIRQTRLRSRSAREARADIEALYQLLANRYPQAIGGGLPPVGFYGP